jgi:hypothetical protein
MESFDKKIIPENIDNFNNLLEEEYMKLLRNDIKMFILKSIEKKDEFYDMNKFFSKNSIEGTLMKEKLIDRIVKELKKNNWQVAKIFGGTSLIIKDNDIDKSLWATNFDFELL